MTSAGSSSGRGGRPTWTGSAPAGSSRTHCRPSPSKAISAIDSVNPRRSMVRSRVSPTRSSRSSRDSSGPNANPPARRISVRRTGSSATAASTATSTATHRLAPPTVTPSSPAAATYAPKINNASTANHTVRRAVPRASKMRGAAIPMPNETGSTM